MIQDAPLAPFPSTIPPAPPAEDMAAADALVAADSAKTIAPQAPAAPQEDQAAADALVAADSNPKPEENQDQTDTVVQWDGLTAQQIADNHALDIKGFVNQNKSAMSPTMLGKLADAYALRNSQGITAGDIGRGFAKAPGALWQMGKGVAALAKAGMKSSPLNPWAIPGLVKDLVTSDHPEAVIGQKIDAAGAELGAGLETMGTGLGDLIRTGVQKIANNGLKPGEQIDANLADPTNFFHPADKIKTLLDDAALIEQKAKAASGEGAILEGSGMDAAALAQQGIEINPEIVQGWATVTDPTLWVPLTAGLRTAKLATGGVGVVNATGKVLGMAPTQAAADFLLGKFNAITAKSAKVIGGGAEKIGAAGETLADKASKLSGLAAGSALVQPHLAVPIVKAWLDKLALAYGSKTLRAVGATLGNDAVAAEIGNLAEASARTAGTAAEGALHGAAFSVPFAAAMKSPEEQADMLATGAALGAVGAGIPRAVVEARNGAVRTAEIAAAAHMNPRGEFSPTVPTVLNVPGLEDLEAGSQSLRTGLETTSPQDAYKGDILRASLNAKGLPAYYVTPEQMASLVPGGEGKFGVARTTVHGKEVQLWTVKDGKVQAQVHEPGHFWFSNATDAEQAALKKTFSPEQIAAYRADLVKSRNYTPAQAKAVDAAEEMAAEALGHVAEGHGLHGAPTGLRNKFVGLVSKLADRLGLVKGEVANTDISVGTGRTTRTGVELAHDSHTVARDILTRAMSDPEVQAALKSVLHQEKPVAGQAAPKPAKVASPAAPIASPFEIAYGELKPGSFEKGLADALVKKSQKGPLSAADKATWDQLFPGIEVPSPTAPVIAPKPPVGTVPVEPAKAVQPPTITSQPEITPAPAPEAAPHAPNVKGVQESELVPFGLSEKAKANITAAAADNASPKTKNVLSTIRDNIGRVLKLTYDSAKEAGSKNAASYKARRAEVEAARNDPGLRDAATKLGVIIKDVNPETGMLETWNGDAVISNIKRVIDQVTKTKSEKLIPYPMEKGKLADGGAKLADDLVAYTRNQNNGYKGDGTPLNRPKNSGAFIPEVNSSYTPTVLSPQVADFANLLMGEQPPITARKPQAGKTPIPVIANKIAGANNRPGRGTGVRYAAPPEIKGQEITDYNPLRGQLKDAGAALDLIPVSEKLHPERIASVEVMPGVKFEPTASHVIASGFMAARVKPEQYEAATRSTLQSIYEREISKLSESEYAAHLAKEKAAGGPIFPSDERPANFMAERRPEAGSNVTKKIQIPIEVEHDGKKYAARLDGIQDFSAMPGGKKMFQITTLEDIPGTRFIKGGTTYDAALIKDGVQVPNLNTPEFADAGKPAPQSFMAERNPEVEKVAEDYMKSTGRPYMPHTEYVQAPPVNLSRRVADAYDAMLHEPTNPAVQKAYDALSSEIIAQYHAIQDAGVTMEPWTEKGPPYANSEEMASDVRDNKHLSYFPTLKGYGKGGADAAHPMLKPSGVMVNGVEVPVNDIFRAVHDYFGHAKNGNGFGPRGEYNAYLAHAAMFGPDAVQALTSETMGQNSWVNFGKHLRNETGTVPARGEKGFVPPQERPYAEQKAALLPPSLVSESLGNKPQFMAARTEAGKAKEEQGFDLVHYEDPASLLNVMAFRPKAGGEDVASLNYYEKGNGKATVSMAFTDTQFRRKGFSEALYREALTDMQDKGITQLDGSAISEGPIAIRKKVIGNVDVQPFISKAGGTYGEIKSVSSKIDPNQKFMANRKTEKREPTGWILPNGQFKKLDGTYHESDLATNSAKYEKDFGVKFAGTNGEVDRLKAVNAGFARVRVDGNGNTTVEVSANAFGKQKNAIREHLNAIAGRANDVTVRVINDKGRTVSEASDNIYMARDKEQAISQILSDIKLPKGAIANEPTLIQRARAGMAGGGEAQFMAERIAQPAVRDEAGDVWEGDGHPDIRAAHEIPDNEGTDGFITNTGRFVTREAALKIAKAAGQTAKTFLGDATGKLYSEELASHPYNFMAERKSKPLPERLPIVDQLELGKPLPPVDRYSRAYTNQLTKEQLREHFPEAIFDKEGRISSDLIGSPLVKRLGEAHAARVVGDKLVDKYRAATAEGNPLAPITKLGETWYSRFAPALKKFFGEDTQMFAEFLAATSPNTNPSQNFKMAVEAHKLFKAGWFDEQIAGYNEGFKKLSDGSLIQDYEDAVPGAQRPANISDATLMKWWIESQGLKPTKAPRLNGKTLSVEDNTLFGISSAAVLKVAARKWITKNSGPKTAQFVKNLTGVDDGATIDVWADRTLREAAYAGDKKRWRILPENSTDVNDADFTFGQTAFKHAADKIGIAPSALQGALWFAEKAQWAEKGWSPLNLGDFMPHLEELQNKGTATDILRNLPATKADALANVEIKRKELVTKAKELAKAEKQHELVIRRAEKRQQNLF